MTRRRSGFSLVETMVAIALLGVIVVTVMGAFSSAALATSRHRHATDLDRLARSDAEYIKAQAYQAKPATYASLTAAGYVFASQILYFNPTNRTFAASNGDNRLQEIVLTVSTASGAQSEQLIFFKVQP